MKYLHTLLFAVYPILFYFNNNKNEIFLSNIFSPLLYSLIFASFLFFIFYLTVKKKENVGVITSVFLLLFFSYGHVLLELGKSYKNLIIGIWVLIFSSVIILSKKDLFKKINPALNFISIFLIIFLLFDILKNPKLIKFADSVIKPSDETSKVKPNEDLRDIYFIVPDRYPAEEVLLKHYDFDNSEFTNYLKQKGFYIADKSRSVYPTTTMSLASELNMKFLNEFTQEFGKETSDFKPVVSLLRNNSVGNFLKSKGYIYINLGSWWHVTQRIDVADINFNSKGLVNDEFVVRFLETTMFSEFSDLILPESLKLNHRNEQRKTADFQSEKIKEIVEMQSPKFVFIHMILPHPPYVFDKDCKFLKEKVSDERTEIENYKEQIQCANKKLKAMIDLIFEKSKKSPIFILQADEGPHPIKSPLPKDNDWKNADNIALEEKFKIFNALYLPEIDQNSIPNDISPVNTFRFIFNNYFEENLEYLPNKTFIFKDQGHIFDYKDITGELR